MGLSSSSNIALLTLSLLCARSDTSVSKVSRRRRQSDGTAQADSADLAYTVNQYCAWRGYRSGMLAPRSARSRYHSCGHFRPQSDSRWFRNPPCRMYPPAPS
ncbi:hypothetical protein EDB85DRAFT_1938395 [Lactarius pseudohatsudake]|nr:hypothetical protein EDB85DRAFT_1938395 [Lactarius pseudohatsudake]